jgi:hypothetical protein
MALAGPSRHAGRRLIFPMRLTPVNPRSTLTSGERAGRLGGSGERYSVPPLTKMPYSSNEAPQGTN